MRFSVGRILAVATDEELPEEKEIVDAKGNHILPGLIDGHVHFRDPGLTYKEDFETGSTNKEILTKFRFRGCPDEVGGLLWFPKDWNAEWGLGGSRKSRP